MAGKRSAAKPQPAANGKVPEVLAREGWVQVTGGAAGDAWEEGMSVSGELVSITDSTFTNDDGSFARNVTILTETGERLLRCPVGLEARLMRLTKGDEVRIDCLGKVKTKGGRRAWSFNVWAKPTAGLKPAIPFESKPGPGRAKGSKNRPQARAAK